MTMIVLAKSIPSRYYGHNNTVFNIEAASLQAMAIHQIINSHGDYQNIKKFIVALAPDNACDLENYLASQSLKQLISTINLSENQYGAAKNIYTHLGAEMNRDFTLGHPLFLLEDGVIQNPDDVRRSGAFNSLHQNVSLLILNELLEEKQNVATAMADIRRVIDNTYWYSYLLKGDERGEVIKTSSVYMGGYSFFF